MDGKTPGDKDKNDKPGQTDPLSERVIFCTECGETIENFCLSHGADDLHAIRKTLAQCKRSGRFTGDFCSKLFIAHPEAFEGPDPDD